MRRLFAADCRLPAAVCRLPIADCRLPTAVCLLLAIASGCLSAQPAMGDPHFAPALAAAKKQGLKAAAVEALDYAGTAALAGVKLGPKGESPATFFYAHVRRDVARALAAEEKAAAEAATKTTLEAKLKQTFPTAEVSVTADGTWEIKKLTPSVAPAPIQEAEAEGGSTGTLLALAGVGAAAAGGWALGRHRRAVV